MGHWIINEYRPDNGKYHKWSKTHTSRNGTAHDGWCDDSKHTLEGNECHFRNIRTFHDTILSPHEANFMQTSDDTMYIITKD